MPVASQRGHPTSAKRSTPPLRDRTDLQAIARRILQAEAPQATPAISPNVMRMFERYAWPGNIRQLANVLRTAAVMAAGEGEITEAHLSDDFLEDQRETPASTPAVAAECSLDESEVALIRAAVDAAGGNISEAAKRLGISRNTIYRKLK